MSEVIYIPINGYITLEEDYTKGTKLRVKKPTKGGAGYAVKIETLNQNHREIINWFYLFDSQDNPEKSMTDNWFRKADFQRWWFSYPNTRDLMNSGPFSARFSELVKFGIFDQTNEVRESYLKTKNGPFYKMNWEKIQEIENKGGLIWQ